MEQYRTPKAAWVTALRNLAEGIEETYPDLAFVLAGLAHAFHADDLAIVKAYVKLTERYHNKEQVRE